MDDEIRDAVTGWDTRAVSDGVRGLHDLADTGFSGAVTDGQAWAFFLNGRVIGVFGGTVDGFEDASLTAHAAPDPSLPLLYTMQETGGETRAQYYTNDTPISTTDETLTSGKFVGYVELAENVMSGDYYVVYYGGRSLPVAFVGNEPTLLTGTEAFERADDEVGIYSVVDADVSVIDLPDRPDDEATTNTEREATTNTEREATTNTEREEAATADTSTEDGPSATDASSPPDASSPADEDGASATPGAESEPGAVTEVEETAAADGSTLEGVTDEEGTAVADASDSGAGDADTGSRLADSEAVDSGVADPGPSAAETEESVGGEATDDGTGTGDQSAAASETEADDGTAASSGGAGADDEVARLRRELETARENAEAAEAARDRAVSERDEHRAEVERLRERVERLAERLADTDDADAGADADTGTTMSRTQALSATNLFVRYDDKADGTLERAVEGGISEDELRANLRLEFHTEFDIGGVRVEGRDFESFLRGTREHRFARWLLTTLPYEIRGTDARSSLSKLYETFERVDRIDFDGTVAATDEETAAFDVVFRDRMGDPLFVAAFDGGRDPTGASVVDSLLDRSETVSRANASFAAAFAVTDSFFDAGAMESAVEATRGGLFSRSNRRSYVKLSRKSGFHLCLVEARDDGFFLTVPEL
jgi:hypothetical protein